MSQNCDVCEFLEKPKHQILLTDKWSIGLGNNHAYLGRAYVTLRTHKASLGELDDGDWREFEELVRKLENAYAKAFRAVPLNWGCFMNNAFQEEPVHPHVHWHIFPRYKQAPEFANITFDDPLYGHHYDPKAERNVSDEVVGQIADKLKQYL